MISSPPPGNISGRLTFVFRDNTRQGSLGVYLFFADDSELHVLHSFLVNVGDYLCGDFSLLFEEVELTQTLRQRDRETTRHERHPPGPVAGGRRQLGQIRLRAQSALSGIAVFFLAVFLLGNIVRSDGEDFV